MDAKLSECSLFQSKIHYLGHAVSKDGIAIDPENIKLIMEWPNPKNVDKVKSFMGLEGYYRNFIRNFPQISILLHVCKGKGIRLNGLKSM